MEISQASRFNFYQKKMKNLSELRKVVYNKLSLLNFGKIARWFGDCQSMYPSIYLKNFYINRIAFICIHIGKMKNYNYFDSVKIFCFNGYSRGAAVLLHPPAM